MKIEEIPVLDTNYSLDETALKVLIADEVLNNLIPLFSDEIEKRQREYKGKISEIIKIKKCKDATQDSTNQIINSIKKEKVITQILTTINKMIDEKLINDIDKTKIKSYISKLKDSDIKRLESKLNKLVTRRKSKNEDNLTRGV